MNRNKIIAAALTLTLSASAPAAAVYAAPMGQMPGAATGIQSQMPGGDMGMQGQMPGGNMNNYTLASSPTTIAESTVVNTAKNLTADESNAESITMSDSNNQVKITSSGTYIITGTCSDGNITVKKGTTGVVLILKDLDLTSKTGATVSINKSAEAKIVISGTVKLTDAEDPADENSTDADTADAFDGAAIKAKDGSNVYLTGTGTLTIDASSCKNGIKVGNEDTPSFEIGGGVKININAANDGINSGYDLTINDATITVSAKDDAIHADRILTVNDGAKITVKSSVEGLEGTVVNIFGGTINVTASDDGINAANSDGTYSSELAFSVNITGGTTVINAGTDGIDSNGNINITGGTITITSANNGGDAGIDYDGSLYISDSATVNNNCGIAGPDGMGAPQNGQMPGGQPSGQTQDQTASGQQSSETTDAYQSTDTTSTDTTDTTDQTTSSEDTSDESTTTTTVVKKKVNKKYSTVTKVYEDGKLVKATIKAKSKAKVTIKKNGKTIKKTTLTQKGTYTVITKKKVSGKWKTEKYTIKIG